MQNLIEDWLFNFIILSSSKKFLLIYLAIPVKLFMIVYYCGRSIFDEVWKHLFCKFALDHTTNMFTVKIIGEHNCSFVSIEMRIYWIGCFVICFFFFFFNHILKCLQVVYFKIIQGYIKFLFCRFCLFWSFLITRFLILSFWLGIQSDKRVFLTLPSTFFGPVFFCNDIELVRFCSSTSLVMSSPLPLFPSPSLFLIGKLTFYCNVEIWKYWKWCLCKKQLERKQVHTQIFRVSEESPI